MNNFRIENKYKIEVAKLDEVYKFFGENYAKTLYPKDLSNQFILITQIFPLTMNL